MLNRFISQLQNFFAAGGAFFVFIVVAFAALSFLAGFLICALSFSASVWLFVAAFMF